MPPITDEYGRRRGILPPNVITVLLTAGIGLLFLIAFWFVVFALPLLIRPLSYVLPVLLPLLLIVGVIVKGLARTTTFSHEHRREFERLREEAEARDVGLWGACSEGAQSISSPESLHMPAPLFGLGEGAILVRACGDLQFTVK